ncbi:MAG: adenylyltransferase/cytidyltransferase family protein, partial [Bacillota bacterium]
MHTYTKMLAVPSIEMYKSEKIVVLSDAAKIIDKLNTQGKIVGLCHGGFDLTHPGHVKHFDMAKKLCDVLFVSITSDKFVSERKGS